MTQSAELLKVPRQPFPPQALAVCCRRIKILINVLTALQLMTVILTVRGQIYIGVVTPVLVMLAHPSKGFVV